MAKQFQILNPFSLVILTSSGKLISTKGIDDLKTKGAYAYEY